MFRSINALYVILIVLAVFGLGLWGYSLCPADVPACVVPDWQERLTSAVKLFLRASGEYPYPHPPWQIIVARYVGPYVIPFVAVLAAAKVAIDNMRRDVRVALARGKRRHFIVCGLGETGMQIVQNLCDADESVVVVDLKGDSANAAAVERQKIPVLRGDAAKPAVLRQAGLMRASAVIVCTGKDTVNADIALRIRETATRRRTERLGHLTVLLELRDEWLFTKLIEHDREALGTESVEIRPFNVYENAARLLIRGLSPQPARDGHAKPLLIFGFGRMGRETALHALRAAPVPLGKRPQLVVFDKDAKALGRRFRAANPMVADFADMEFIQADPESEAPEAWKTVEAKLDAVKPLAVAVCFPDDHSSLYVALEVRARLDRRGQFGAPLFVRLQQHQRLGAFAAHIERLEQYQDRLGVFGALEDMLTHDILVGARLDALAAAHHRYYIEQKGAAAGSNPAAQPWRLLPEQYRVSNRRQADHIGVKLAQIGLKLEPAATPSPFKFSDDEIDLLAQLEHRRWTIERQLLGWTYGPTRDDGRRLNPYLVDWKRLPDEVRNYNRDAVKAMPKILASAGFEIRRDAH